MAADRTLSGVDMELVAVLVAVPVVAEALVAAVPVAAAAQTVSGHTATV